MTSSTSRVGFAAETRSNATPESLSLRLLVRSPDELFHVDQLLRHFERVSGQGWMRRVDEQAWHEIREIACGAVMTYCAGSAPGTSVRAEFDLEPRPMVSDRCQACQRLHVQRRMVEVGLREIVAATEPDHG